MYSFFVLGQVPDTNITISFTMWLQLGALIIGLVMLRMAHNRRATFIAPLLPTISNE